MPIGNVPPPSQHPDEPPFVCIPINTEWIPILLGALQPLKYPEYWSGTLEESRGARKDFGILLDQIMQAEDCGMSGCCLDLYVIQRISPDTGLVEVSVDNGVHWQPAPGSIPTKIVEPVPPVTSGLAATKCDAAQNVATQIDDWIEHVSTAFDVATGLADFAIIVASAILDAVLLILTEGGLTAAEVQIIEIIGAISTAVWSAGKSVFDDYWSSENKDIIFCAAFTTIGDNGAFTDTQFSAFWNLCNEKLSASIAKSLFLGFISSVGRQGLNAMSASGLAADSDCASCITTCDLDNWTTVIGTEVGRTATTVTVDAVLSGGNYEVAMETSTVSPWTQCCHFLPVADSGSFGTPVGRVLCGNDNTNPANIVFPLGYDDAVNLFFMTDASPFTVTITFTE